MKLLVRPRPRTDESFAGYVLRLTERNGYQTPSWILERAGLEHLQLHHSCAFVFSPGDGVKKLARLTGTAEVEIERLTCRKVDGSRLYRFFGQTVFQYTIRAANPKVCPGCLTESPYCHRVWELSPATACPYHRCLLIDVCPGCRRRICWVRGRVCVCPCGLDWRSVTVRPIEESELALTRHIHRLCGLPGNDRGQPDQVGHSPVSALPLHDLLAAVIFVAGQYEGLTGVTGKHLTLEGKTPRENPLLHQLLVKAYSAFEDWPENYYRFLSWRRTQAGNITPRDRLLKTGVRKEFGKFHQGLDRYLPGDQFNFMRDAFAGYLASRWEGGHVSNLNRGSRKTCARDRGGRYVSRAEARRLLATAQAWVDRFVEEGRLKAVVRPAGKKRLFMVERESLEKLKADLDELLGTEEVCRMLGVGRFRLMTLIREEHLRPARGPSVDGFAQWKFTRAAVNESLSNARDHVDVTQLLGQLA